MKETDGDNNTVDGIDLLLQTYAKNAKLRMETPITQNMTANSTEGETEQQPVGKGTETQPIVSVTQDSPNAP